MPAATVRRSADRGSNQQQSHLRPLARLRRDYFAYGRDAALRWGVTFDDVLLHWWAARNRVGVVALRRIRFVADAMHAAACCNNSAGAWADLLHHHERTLTQRCLTVLEEPEAAEHVRRVLADIQRFTRDGDSRSPLSLRGFIGTQTMRQWLVRTVKAQLKAKGAALAVDEKLQWVWHEKRERGAVRSATTSDRATQPGRA